MSRCVYKKNVNLNCSLQKYKYTICRAVVFAGKDKTSPEADISGFRTSCLNNFKPGLMVSRVAAGALHLLVGTSLTYMLLCV